MAELLLKRLIADLGMTQEEFREKYATAAAQLYRETRDRAFSSAAAPATMTVYRWASGMTGMPRSPAPKILERMFNTPARQLFAPCTDSPTNTTIEPAFDESELRMTAKEAASHAGDAASQILPDLTLDQIEDDLIRLIRANSATPPHLVYIQGKEILALSRIMLDRTQILSQRRRLYLVAGQSAALLGGCSFDLGSISTAIELMRASALYGQVAEHGPLQAYAHGYLAILAYWSSNPSQALRMVQTAQRFPDVGDVGQLRLAAIEARVYGHLGKPVEAERAIRASLEPGNGRRDEIHDGVGGEFAFNAERIAMSNSSTYLLLRDGTGAEESALHSLELIEQAPIGSTPRPIGPQASADLAMARLLRRDLDGAIDALEPVFDLPREWRGAGLVDRVNAVRTELAGPTFRTAPAALTAAEQIEDFVVVAAPNVLGTGTSAPAIES